MPAALQDPCTVEVRRNSSDGRLWQDGLGEALRDLGCMPAWQAEALIRTMAASLKVSLRPDEPLSEGQRWDGGPFGGQLPPVVVLAPTGAIRGHARAVLAPEQYVTAGLMRLQPQGLLPQAIGKHRHRLVCGSTGHGKTTRCKGLIRALPPQDSDQRLLLLEASSESQCAAPNAVKYLSHLEVKLTRLLRMRLRMRPNRLRVGEVGGPAALELLMAWNTGQEGGLAPLQANPAKAALWRLATLRGIMHPEAPQPIEPLMGESVDLIVQLARAKADAACARGWMCWHTTRAATSPESFKRRIQRRNNPNRPKWNNGLMSHKNHPSVWLTITLGLLALAPQAWAARGGGGRLPCEPPLSTLAHAATDPRPYARLRMGIGVRGARVDANRGLTETKLG